MQHHHLNPDTDGKLFEFYEQFPKLFYSPEDNRLAKIAAERFVKNAEKQRSKWIQRTRAQRLESARIGWLGEQAFTHLTGLPPVCEYGGKQFDEGKDFIYLTTKEVSLDLKTRDSGLDLFRTKESFDKGIVADLYVLAYCRERGLKWPFIQFRGWCYHGDIDTTKVELKRNELGKMDQTYMKRHQELHPMPLLLNAIRGREMPVI